MTSNKKIKNSKILITKKWKKFKKLSSKNKINQKYFTNLKSKLKKINKL